VCGPGLPVSLSRRKELPMPEIEAFGHQFSGERFSWVVEV